MNGRVYDQVVGRFLSADPYVQALGITQSFNRYSCTWNNPLAFVDPSGFKGRGVDEHQLGGGASIQGATALPQPASLGAAAFAVDAVAATRMGGDSLPHRHRHQSPHR